ncbi:hypothetical protein GCM10008934_02710 [Virgibacillus salarius]|uniref:YopX family protein n=1 Tax=Virgibacillus salarius TaxID=447199 RepID=UPI0031D6F97E
MRKIKVRGLSIEPLANGDKWITDDDEYHDIYINHADRLAYIQNHPVHYESISEYTGLKDVEQFEEPKELYTGDIVSMHQFLFDGNEVENEIIGVLDYDEEVAAVCLTEINNNYIQKYMGYENDEVGFKREKIPVCMFYGLHECSWTYLGNIHEHPHLLEEGVTSEEEMT